MKPIPNKPTTGMALCLSIIQLLSTLPAMAVTTNSEPADLGKVAIKAIKNTQATSAEIQKLKVANASKGHSDKGVDSSTGSASNTSENSVSSVAAGGDGSGGGNAFGAKAVNPSEINELLNRSKQVAVYILRNIEYLTTEYFPSISSSISDPADRSFNDSYSEIGRKLFKSKKTIYQALAEAQLNSIENGPCTDSDGNNVDASAKDSPSICFSLTRLTNRLNSESVQIELLALVIHEVSHMVGTTEKEAIKIQNMIKSALTNNPYYKIPQLVENYKFDVIDAQDTINFIRENLERLHPLEICSGVSTILPMINNLYQKNMNSVFESGKNGIIFSSLQELNIIQGSLMKSLNLMTYCNARLPKYKKIKDAFAGRSEMLLSEFQSAIYPSVNLTIKYPSGIIRYINPGEINALSMELVDLSLAMKKVLDNL